MWLHATTVFLSAFLLFQVQPLLAKAILPWFGGTPAVWTTCMLFFQTLLLGGYAYAHWLARQPLRRQRRLHLTVLGGALLFLQILPGPAWRPPDGDQPALRILLLLAAKVGLPYFALSATGPLLQAWFRGQFPGHSPYRLYALSNTGSLLALLSYPFVFEPWLSLRGQALGWAGLYVLFVILCGRATMRAQAPPAEVSEPAAVAGGIVNAAVKPRWPWVVWPACSSVLLLATTNQMSQDVSVVPFLWVLPLSVYLLSFILCFDSDRWYRRDLWMGFWPVAAAEMCLALYWGVDLELRWQVLAHTSALFVGCMICHGELAASRPAARGLTGYYLAVAAGGAVGALLVSVMAPAVLPDLWEYQAAWVAIGLLMVWALWQDRRWWSVVTRAVLVLCLIGVLVWLGQRSRANEVAVRRNFYGVLRVLAASFTGERWPSKRLMHGRITHGMQFGDGELRWKPISYYAPATGVGLAIQALPEQPRRLGVVGLGAGVMAAWGRAGDTVRFYEINPAVVQLSAEHFTYGDGTLARIETVLGDARLSLEREVAAGGQPPLDLLVLDAFSGDSIPLHLLTQEAFALYKRRLRQGGVVAVHISNRYLRLEGLVRGLAAANGQYALLMSNEAETETGTDASTWILVSDDAQYLAQSSLAAAKSSWAAQDRPLVFTDGRCNLWQLLR